MPIGTSAGGYAAALQPNIEGYGQPARGGYTTASGGKYGKAGSYSSHAYGTYGKSGSYRYGSPGSYRGYYSVDT